MEQLLHDVAELKALTARAAFTHYLRKGRVPEELTRLAAICVQIEEMFADKANPNWQS